MKSEIYAARIKVLKHRVFIHILLFINYLHQIFREQGKVLLRDAPWHEGSDTFHEHFSSIPYHCFLRSVGVYVLQMCWQIFHDMHGPAADVLEHRN